MTSNQTAMPDLPKHYRLLINGTSLEPATPVYTAEQMHDYARAAIQALSQQGEPVACTKDAEDAKRWRAFRSRDEFPDLDYMCFENQFREDADAVIDAALAQKENGNGDHS